MLLWQDDGEGDADEEAPSPRGLDPAVLRALPVVAAAVGAGDCAVCLAEFERGEQVRVLPRCNHGFHAACIDTVLRQHPTCPICRSPTKHRAAAGTLPPVYYAVAMAPPPFQAPTSSSDQGALQQADAATAAVGAEHMDVTSSRLELEIVISDEPASSDAPCQSTASEEHPCAETRRQSSQGNAWEHRQC